MEKIISGCNECPLADMNDFCAGATCRLKDKGHKLIKEDNNYQLVTPDWCPLKKDFVLFRIKDKNLK